MSQDSPKAAKDIPKMANIGLNRAPDSPRQAQSKPNMAQGKPKTSLEWPKTKTSPKQPAQRFCFCFCVAMRWPKLLRPLWVCHQAPGYPVLDWPGHTMAVDKNIQCRTVPQCPSFGNQRPLASPHCIQQAARKEVLFKTMSEAQPCLHTTTRKKRKERRGRRRKEGRERKETKHEENKKKKRKKPTTKNKNGAETKARTDRKQQEKKRKERKGERNKERTGRNVQARLATLTVPILIRVQKNIHDTNCASRDGSTSTNATALRPLMDFIWLKPLNWHRKQCRCRNKPITFLIEISPDTRAIGMLEFFRENRKPF